MKEFHGHTSRVLHLARSPDGATICSASADETIRFWDIFGPGTNANSRRGSGAGDSGGGSRGGGGGARDGLPSGSMNRSGSLFNNGASAGGGSMHVR